MTGNVILVVGLPGCGKTTYVDKLTAEFGAQKFDDFKANAHYDSPTFQCARRFDELIIKLVRGETCIVADIDFCRNEARIEAEEEIKGRIPGVKVEWHYFENDPIRCRRNVIRRKSNSVQQELLNIDRYSPGYDIPSPATLIRVPEQP
ncbi:MAG: hypothetical protein A3H28_06205 [Acidobacteria bacterium RIFCSPLOWO2_02_FULL_61_28]|nr:MAG: hypothetical protein A3H28_06205 [Acidobacteria bacterium RIFCSPLOWO2_02_FULL_61_28]